MPRFLALLQRRLRLMIGRSRVALTDDTPPLQTVQVQILEGETRSDLEHVQPYGLAYRTHPGAEAVGLFPNGQRSHGMVIVVADRRYRLKGLAEGEVALYTDEGDKIHLKRGRQIEVVGGEKVTVSTKVADIAATTSAKVTSPTVELVASTKVRLDSPLVEMTGQLEVAGAITGQGGLAVSGGSGASVQGDMTISGGNVTADGIGLKTHVHGGVQPGAGTTGTPQ